VREKGERGNLSFNIKKLAKNYLAENGESVTFGLGRRVRFATLAGGAS
jgi:hypothetical protein